MATFEDNLRSQEAGQGRQYPSTPPFLMHTRLPDHPGYTAGHLPHGDRLLRGVPGAALSRHVRIGFVEQISPLDQGSLRFQAGLTVAVACQMSGPVGIQTSNQGYQLAQCM